MLKTKVLWIKVWGLAAVQGAITLTWVIYNLYLPLLLVELGFSKKSAIAILIVENALESLIEPIFGGLSDRQQRVLGSKIPLISWGIISASGLFILFPCLVIFGSAQFAVKWLLPVLAVIWASAMAIFRAPTISLLGRYATSEQLPQAASILTLVGAIIGAFRFDAYGLILSLGTGFAFTLGSFSLLGAAMILRSLNTDNLVSHQPSKSAKVSLLLLSLLFSMGIWVSWSLRFIMPAVKEILELQFGATNGKLAMTSFLISLGLAALPAGKIATQFNNYRTMQLGVSVTIVALILLALFPQVILPIILITLSFSLVLNGIIPLVLTLVPPEKSGLSTGLYFGGLGAGMSIYSFVFSPLQNTDLQINIWGAITCLSLLCCWLVTLNVLQRKT